ncbi:universal stress protein [Dactylosporangium sp. NBC_01737]|uniref:universal stress protein n=1 Tax=Dactylosporangium sp. NBC_01737 TaxID=2975959 RepID=UPI002E14DED1|nr:universal stress protein [Dactylosporangium sp. NBC_01737]
MTDIHRPVIVGVDGSPASLGAVRWAADEAVRLRQPLQIVHALEATEASGPAPDEHELTVRAAVDARGWHPGLHVTTCTWRGGPGRVLIDQSRHAGLVVVASRGTGGFQALPVGSVGEQLAAHAHCPVLVVHDAQRWADPSVTLPQQRPVVVGTDGSAHAQHAIELAFAEAGSRHVDLIAVRAWQEPPRHWGRASRRERLADDVQHALARELEPWLSKHPAVSVELRSVHGAVVPVLLAEAQDALMVVLSPRGTGGFDALRLGSVTQQVLDHAPVPVLVARR